MQAPFTVNNLPGKLRGGRIINGRHYQRVRWRPFRRKGHIAFNSNPRQDPACPHSFRRVYEVALL